MHKRKKGRLEARGWRLGSAQEFLGLSIRPTGDRLRPACILPLRFRGQSVSDALQIIRSQLHAVYVLAVLVRLVTPLLLG